MIEKRFKIRSLCWMLCIGLCGMLFHAGAYAQDVELTVEDVIGVPGGDIQLQVNARNAFGIEGFVIEFEFLPELGQMPLQFIRIQDTGTITQGWTFVTLNQISSSGILRVVAANTGINETPEGVLFSVVFAVDAGAFGQTIDANITTGSDINDGALPLFVQNGFITIDGPPPVATDTPTIAPSPTESPTPTQTPTVTLTPTPTPTFDPFATPPTPTTRPQNTPPVIVIEPTDRFEVLVGQPLDMLVIASDADGDVLDVFLSLNARAALKSEEQLPNSRLVEFTLDTSIVGESTFVVFANDGIVTTQKEVVVSVVASLTPVPTVTPTPKTVTVTDDLQSTENLTGKKDFDEESNRQLTIRWNAPVLNAVDWHVYVQSGFGTRRFLGRTGGGDIRILNWTPNSTVINDEFINGPQFGNLYSFTVIRIDEAVTPDDFFNTDAPVGFNQTGGGELPQPAVPFIVTDDSGSLVDLSGQTDFDSPEERELTIRWTASPANAVDWQIFVRRGFGERKFLGRTNTGFTDHFSWKPDAPFLNPEFIEGPQFNSIYQFEVIRIDNRLGDDDFLLRQTPVGFNFVGGNPLPIVENPVKVFDHPGTTVDLTGLTDFDNPGERFLTIRWSQPTGSATDWHVYVREGLGGRKFLGRTGNGTIQEFNWFPGADHVSPDFRNGPRFNQFYNFRVVRIDGDLSRGDIFDQPAPVGFNQTGEDPVPLSIPSMNSLNGRRIAIFDDILASDDLAPIGNVGRDTDSSDRRFIHIAWNFNMETSTIFDHHIEVSVNQGPFRFLGQTNDNNQQFFWWSPDQLFSTAPAFVNGPQDGNEYQFRVSRRNPVSPLDFLTSGTLTYQVDSGVITPTPTQTSSLQPPTFTPSPTFTPTLTPTPTDTPTPTPTPVDLPFTFKSLDPNGEMLELSLPGVVNEILPLQFQLIRLGRFNLGSPENERGRDNDETQIQNVDITRNFFLGKYEVTQAQWQAVMGNNPAWFDDQLNKPVESITWNQAREFLTILNQRVNQGLFRLPTEAEWEYAARGGTQTRFSFGNALDCADTGGVFCSEFDRFMWWLGNNTTGDNPFGTKPAGLKAPNPFGLFDIHGNVAEWCQDWFGPYNPANRINPQGSPNGTRRVVRGGSWANDATMNRSANRQSELPNNRNVTLGFRVAWQVERANVGTE